MGLANQAWVSLTLISIGCAVILTGCGGDEPPPENAKPQRPPPAAAGSAKKPGSPSAKDSAAAARQEPPGLPPLPVREFQESDFAESDTTRDPFRSFETTFAAQAKGKVKVQRQVIVDRYALDELKLIGMVTRGAPRAMFADPTGLGWVVKVGDYLGKAEIVQTGGPAGGDVAINWRVDRIRDQDVVFVREDPSHPDIPPTTRVIALYPVEDADSKRSGRR